VIAGVWAQRIINGRHIDHQKATQAPSRLILAELGPPLSGDKLKANSLVS